MVAFGLPLGPDGYRTAGRRGQLPLFTHFLACRAPSLCGRPSSNPANPCQISRWYKDCHGRYMRGANSRQLLRDRKYDSANITTVPHRPETRSCRLSAARPHRYSAPVQASRVENFVISHNPISFCGLLLVLVSVGLLYRPNKSSGYPRPVSSRLGAASQQKFRTALIIQATIFPKCGCARQHERQMGRTGFSSGDQQVTPVG